MTDENIERITPEYPIEFSTMSIGELQEILEDPGHPHHDAANKYTNEISAKFMEALKPHLPKIKFDTTGFNKTIEEAIKLKDPFTEVMNSVKANMPNFDLDLPGLDEIAKVAAGSESSFDDIDIPETLPPHGLPSTLPLSLPDFESLEFEPGPSAQQFETLISDTQESNAHLRQLLAHSQETLGLTRSQLEGARKAEDSSRKAGKNNLIAAWAGIGVAIILGVLGFIIK